MEPDFPSVQRKRPRSKSMAAFSSTVSLLIFALGTGDAFAPHIHVSSLSRDFLHVSLSSTALKQSFSDNEADEDWRAFRARLVQNESKYFGDNEGSENDDGIDKVEDKSYEAIKGDGRYAHETTPLVETGTILVSIPTTDVCQALEQQFWHRSVVLITRVSDDKIRGDEETVPQEQLAEGDGKGRWSYRGLLLNRLTDLMFDGETGEEESFSSCSRHDNIGWRIFRGGDLASLDLSDGYTSFKCLHSLYDTDVREVSTRLVGNLFMIDLHDAQQLCADSPSKFSPTDFYTFGGFCSWRPGQLEREMGEGRGEWLAISMDADSILDGLNRQLRESELISVEKDLSNRSSRLLQGGTTLWRTFLAMIGRNESRATERIPAGQLNFYDRMLMIWAETYLVSSPTDDSNDNVPIITDSSKRIGPGTIVRAKEEVSNDVLLFDQELIKSLVLVLEETDEATVGIILNHPLGAAVDCLEDGSPLPVRYGGPVDKQTWEDGSIEDYSFDSEDDEMYGGYLEYVSDPENAFDYDDSQDDFEEDDDDDDSPFIWLHRDAELGARGRGTPLGTSGTYLIGESDAISALQSGLLSTEDTMVFSGVCIWEKSPDIGICGGGLKEQIDGLQSMEIVRGCNDQFDLTVIEMVWDILSFQQHVLTKDSFDSNINAAAQAWAACNIGSDNLATAKNSARVELSNAALRGWLGVNLLLDPLGTLVQVQEMQERESFGQ